MYKTRTDTICSACVPQALLSPEGQLWKQAEPQPIGLALMFSVWSRMTRPVRVRRSAPGGKKLASRAGPNRYRTITVFGEYGRRRRWLYSFCLPHVAAAACLVAGIATVWMPIPIGLPLIAMGLSLLPKTNKRFAGLVGDLRSINNKINNRLLQAEPYLPRRFRIALARSQHRIL